MRNITELDKQSPGKHPKWLNLCLACETVSPPTARLPHQHCECRGNSYCDTLAHGPWHVPSSAGLFLPAFFAKQDGDFLW